MRDGGFPTSVDTRVITPEELTQLLEQEHISSSTLSAKDTNTSLPKAEVQEVSVENEVDALYAHIVEKAQALLEEPLEEEQKPAYQVKTEEDLTSIRETLVQFQEEYCREQGEKPTLHILNKELSAIDVLYRRILEKAWKQPEAFLSDPEALSTREEFRQAFDAMLFLQLKHVLSLEGLTPEDCVQVEALRAAIGYKRAALGLGVKSASLGLKRDHDTLENTEWYNGVAQVKGELEGIRAGKGKLFLSDNMFATGGSFIGMIERFVEGGNNEWQIPVTQIHILSAMASPEGLMAVKNKYPEIAITTIAQHNRLNEKGYIMDYTPSGELEAWGDCGDEYFGGYSGKMEDAQSLVQYLDSIGLPDEDFVLIMKRQCEVWEEQGLYKDLVEMLWELLSSIEQGHSPFFYEKIRERIHHNFAFFQKTS